MLNENEKAELLKLIYAPTLKMSKNEGVDYVLFIMMSTILALKANVSKEFFNAVIEKATNLDDTLPDKNTMLM